MGLIETLQTVSDVNQELSKLAFGSNWGQMNRRAMVNVLEKTVTHLNDLLNASQALSVFCAQEKITNYQEQNVKRIQESIQYFERNLQFEKSVAGKNNDDSKENETFVALQEKLQWLVSTVRNGVDKTQSQVPKLIENIARPDIGSAANQVVMSLHQKELELMELKDRLQQLQLEKVTISHSHQNTVDHEQSVYELAKKIEYYLTNLKHSSVRRQSLANQVAATSQEIEQYTQLMEEQLPKLIGECFSVISTLKQERETLQKQQLELSSHLQSVRETNAKEIIRLQEIALLSQKQAEEKVRFDKKSLLQELQQKNELLNHFQKKYHEHEKQLSDLIQEKELLHKQLRQARSKSIEFEEEKESKVKKHAKK